MVHVWTRRPTRRLSRGPFYEEGEILLKLATKIIIALIVGAITGLLLNIFAPNVFKVLDPYLFTPLGQIFLNLIKMLVVPIVFFRSHLV